MADEILGVETSIETVAAAPIDATPASPVPMDTPLADMPPGAPEGSGGGVDSGAVAVTAPAFEPQNGGENAGTGSDAGVFKIRPSEDLRSDLKNQGWRGVLARGLEAIRFRKRGKLEKIMTLVAANGSVTNDQVEKLLQVSDATASRYLAQLVAAGRLRRIGRDGGAKYETNNGSNRTI